MSADHCNRLLFMLSTIDIGTIRTNYTVCHVNILLFIIRRKRSMASGKLWKHYGAKKTVLTRSAITWLKVNGFGWKLEHCEHIVEGYFLADFEGWPWQILGAIRAVVTVWEATEFFFVR